MANEKAVMISIQPKWCAKIASGEKTIEVRKTKPKLETPFKVYIYCTKSRTPYESFGVNKKPIECGGKVIGEFVCDFIPWYISELWDDETFERIQEVLEPDDFAEYGEYEYHTIADNGDDFWEDNMLCKAACLSVEELRKYIGAGFQKFYGWHISDLKIYDEPKALSDFRRPCVNDLYCESCGMYSENSGTCGNAALQLKRAPQSWCYVEEVSP